MTTRFLLHLVNPATGAPVSVLVYADDLGSAERAVRGRPLLDLIARLTIGNVFVPASAWSSPSSADCEDAIDLDSTIGELKP